MPRAFKAFALNKPVQLPYLHGQGLEILIERPNIRPSKVSTIVQRATIPITTVARTKAVHRSGASSEAGAGGSEQPSDVVSDSTLVLACIDGERFAFDELVRRYQRQAVGVSYRLLGNTHDALEVTQDAFLKAYTSLKSLQNPEAFGGWILRIVSNLSLNARRGRKSRSSLRLSDLMTEDANSGLKMSPDSVWTASETGPLHRLESQEMGDRLSAALASLPEKQQLALVMFTIEQLPQKDIAEALACSVEAVKWHVFQGRKKLKKILKDHLQQ